MLECEKRLDSTEYRTKIEKWCRKFGFDFNLVFEKAQNDLYFRAFFVKDPKKQNIYESLVAKYIKSLDFVFDFKKLSGAARMLCILTAGMLGKEGIFS